MARAWGRARHKRHCGQFIDITFAPQHSCPRPAQSLPTRWAKRWNNGNRCRSKRYASNKEQYVGVMQILDLDATPQEGLLSDPPPKGSAEDMLFDYLEPKERRIYNDLARRIQKRFEELESEKSKRRDRCSDKQLINLMQG
jgi:hypothetical protein